MRRTIIRGFQVRYGRKDGGWEVFVYANLTQSAPVISQAWTAGNEGDALEEAGALIDKILENRGESTRRCRYCRGDERAAACDCV